MFEETEESTDTDTITLCAICDLTKSACVGHRNLRIRLRLEKTVPRRGEEHLAALRRQVEAGARFTQRTKTAA